MLPASSVFISSSVFAGSKSSGVLSTVTKCFGWLVSVRPFSTMTDFPKNSILPAGLSSFSVPLSQTFARAMNMPFVS